MRLWIIIVTGLIAIGATYMWSSANSQQPKVMEPEPPVRAKSLKVEKAPESKSPDPKGNIATSLEKAREAAKAASLNKDPFAPLAETESFPSTDKEAEAASAAKKSTVVIPPPPKNQPGGPFGDMPGPPGSASALSSTGLVPPPPPTQAGYFPSGLSLSDLPMPPDKPSLAAKVTLVSIVGQKAIFEIRDMLARRQHGWPKNFTLGPGEEFEGMKVLTVKNNEAIVEEHGETMLKELPPVR